jgi:hypothetical protein
MKTKRLTRKEKEEQTVIDVINEMFKIAGHDVSYDDVKGRKDAWFNDWTITEDQYHEWLKWGKKYLQKNLRMYANMAEREMAMMGLMWGLKFERPLERQYEQYCDYASKLQEPDYRFLVDDPNQNCTRLMTKEEFAASELYIKQE